MKRIPLFVILFTSFLQGQTLIDVFPLARNIHYSYSYFRLDCMADLTVWTSIIQDSGTIEYVVKDSTTLADTAILWTVQQSRVLLHRNYSIGFFDSLYLIADTSQVSLIERKAGAHEITCNGLAWSFPLTTPDANVLRFTSSTDTLIARTYLFYGRYNEQGADSLWFSRENGFYRRHWYDQFANSVVWTTEMKLELLAAPTSVPDRPNSNPTAFFLDQNYPNPWNPATTIIYGLPNGTSVLLSLYDILGRRIKVLDSGFRAPGKHSVVLSGEDLTSGVYFYRLDAGPYTKIRKLLLLK